MPHGFRDTHSNVTVGPLTETAVKRVQKEVGDTRAVPIDVETFDTTYMGWIIKGYRRQAAMARVKDLGNQASGQS